jgi:hypothetical protein
LTVGYQRAGHGIDDLVHTGPVSGVPLVRLLRRL